MTNFEWIKSLNISSMSSLIADFMNCELPEDFTHEDKCMNCNEKTCFNCVKEWLEKKSDCELMCDEKQKDYVNHPAHYNREGAMECVEEMKMLFTKEEVLAFFKLTAYRYRYRAGQKWNGLEDLQKSDWYMREYKKLVDGDKDNNKYTINTYSTNDYPISILCSENGCPHIDDGK